MIYAIKAGGYTKIGTTKDFDKRLRSIQNGCPFKIEVLFLMEGSFEQESKVHRQLKLYNTYGEWYQLPVDVDMELLELLMDEDDIQEKEKREKKVRRKRYKNRTSENRPTKTERKFKPKRLNNKEKLIQTIDYQKKLGIFITRASTAKNSNKVYPQGLSLSTVKKHWYVVDEDVTSYNLSNFFCDSNNDLRAMDSLCLIEESYNKGNRSKMAIHKDTGISRVTIDKYWNQLNK